MQSCETCVWNAIQVATELDSRFEDWITRLRDQESPLWEPVTLVDFQTTGNENVSLQSDGAVLLSGEVPPTVDHTFVLQPPDKPITAIRVELLTDDSIPGSGPGRGEAGRPNVILSEVTCEVMSGKEKSKVVLSTAVADYSQPNWDVARAIDGDRKTGWAIGGQFGKPHWATFLLAEPLLLDPESQSLKVKSRAIFWFWTCRWQATGLGQYTVSGSVVICLTTCEACSKGRSCRSSNGNKLRTEFEKVDKRLLEIDQSIARD